MSGVRADGLRVWFSLGNQENEYVMFARRVSEELIPYLGEWSPFAFFQMKGPSVFSLHSFKYIGGDEKHFEVSFSYALVSEDGIIINESIVEYTQSSAFSSKSRGKVYKNVYFHKSESKTDERYILSVFNENDLLVDKVYIFVNPSFNWFRDNIEISKATAFKLKEESYNIITESGVSKKNEKE